MAQTGCEIKPSKTRWEIHEAPLERIVPIQQEDAPLPPKRHGGLDRIEWTAAFEPRLRQEGPEGAAVHRAAHLRAASR